VRRLILGSTESRLVSDLIQQGNILELINALPLASPQTQTFFEFLHETDSPFMSNPDSGQYTLHKVYHKEHMVYKRRQVYKQESCLLLQACAMLVSLLACCYYFAFVF